jgi:hypothetical protein
MHNTSECVMRIRQQEGLMAAALHHHHHTLQDAVAGACSEFYAGVPGACAFHTVTGWCAEGMGNDQAYVAARVLCRKTCNVPKNRNATGKRRDASYKQVL